MAPPDTAAAGDQAWPAPGSAVARRASLPWQEIRSMLRRYAWHRTADPAIRPAMDFDQLLIRFFGTADIDTLAPERLGEGVERLRLQFGLERDGGRRFALWCIMYLLGVAPDLDVAFADEGDREAARDFMDEVDRDMAEDEAGED